MRPYLLCHCVDVSALHTFLSMLELTEYAYLYQFSVHTFCRLIFCTANTRNAVTVQQLFYKISLNILLLFHHTYLRYVLIIYVLTLLRNIHTSEIKNLP